MAAISLAWISLAERKELRALIGPRNKGEKGGGWKRIFSSCWLPTSSKTQFPSVLISFGKV
jgi:hypothetical protein